MTGRFINRYGHARYFHDDTKGEVWVTGEILSLRIGGEIDDIQYVDPDGGPFIHKGENLKMYFKDDKDRFVTQIKVGGMIKLFYKTESNEQEKVQA